MSTGHLSAGDGLFVRPVSFLKAGDGGGWCTQNGADDRFTLKK